MSSIQSILAIDDDPDALQVLCEYLQLEGFEVHKAHDGATGVQLLAEHDVQLVVTDLNMPGLTGMDVIEIVRKNYPHLQIIVVTGYGTMETALEALHKGAIDYLVKPYMLETLKLSLRKAEHQTEMNRRLERLGETPADPLQLESVIGALPQALALLGEEPRPLAANAAFDELLGRWKDSGPANVDPKHHDRLQRFLQAAREESSVLIHLKPVDERRRVVELSLHGLKDREVRWLLMGDEVVWDQESGQGSEEPAVMVVSRHGTLLWANTQAVDLLELDLESVGDCQFIELLDEQLQDSFRSALDENAPVTACFRWIAALDAVAGYRQELEVEVTPLLNELDRRVGHVIYLRRPSPSAEAQSYYRREEAGGDVPLLYADREGRVQDVSQAFQDLVSCGVEELLGSPLDRVLKWEDGEEGSVCILHCGKQEGRLYCLARADTPAGRVYQFQSGDEHPLEDRIEQQKEQLFRTTSLLSHLLSEAGAGDCATIEDNLNEVAVSLVNSGFFNRAALYLTSRGEVIGWGFAGLDPEERRRIREDAEWMRRCEQPGPCTMERAGATLVFPSREADFQPEQWEADAYLLMPIEGRDSGVMGRLRLEGSRDSKIPNEAQVRIVEMMLRQVALSLDELELERQVRRTEEKYRTLYENAKYSIIIVDLEDGRILDVNREAERLTGYSSSELVGRRIWEIRAADFRDTARRNWLKTVRREATSFENIPLLRKDGATVYVEYDSMFSEFDGRPVLQSFYRDVTEKQALEFSLIQSQKLAGLGQLSAGIAHELRNPLGIINSSLYYVNSVMEKEDLPQSDQLRKHLGIIKNEVSRSQKIIENLLSFSRVSSHDRELVDLNDLLRVTLDLVKKELLVNNIQLETELAALPSLHLNVDELKQAFLNIILNSTQAMPEGGTLRIRSNRDEERIRLSFEDTGQGINKEDMANVLNPFFTTKDPGVGTGLGLSLTHSFIKRAGGDLSIESVPGAGTTVRIYLPAGQ